ncbi:MAG: RpiB/LacA/LacB family sugar-phosphate isomerase [Culicoidibacterales bacterium]
MKIAIGCDHIVTDIKAKMVLYLQTLGHEVLDCGTNDFQRTHYPIYGKEVAIAVASGAVDRGIVICGTGVGITVSTTKINGIRAVLTKDIVVAKVARKQYDANILGLGGRVVGIGLMEALIETFLTTPYVATAKTEQNKAELASYEQPTLPTAEIFDELLGKWDNGFYDEV